MEEIMAPQRDMDLSRRKNKEGTESPYYSKQISKMKKDPFRAAKQPKIERRCRIEKKTGKLRKVPFMGQKAVAPAHAIGDRQVKGLVDVGVTETALPKQKNKTCQKRRGIQARQQFPLSRLNSMIHGILPCHYKRFTGTRFQPKHGFSFGDSID
ncbi:MAG: hypothetical protein IJT62_08115 [Oscillospiraceae bacterium]|nr:hypothetical protein [Oscillospiraceae bacterium]